MAEDTKNLSFIQRVALESLWIICRGFALLPHIIRHNIIGNTIFFVLCYIMRYRRKVMWENLSRSFPEKSEAELKRICVGAYRNLAEQIVNTISLAGLSDEELLSRMAFPNSQVIRDALNGQSAIFMSGHYGPWEAGSIVSLIFPEQEFVAIYHKLNSPVMDTLMKRIRQHTNIRLVEMRQTMRYFVGNSSKRSMIIALIADQYPKYRAGMHWYKFLHQWTTFHEGGETLARKYKLPVYYIDLSRIKAGHYESKFIQLYDGKEEIAEYEITQRYIDVLEAKIKQEPSLWIWTHRRWKAKPPKELLEQEI